jgi:hypothetical protein
MICARELDVGAVLRPVPSDGYHAERSRWKHGA